MPNFWSRAPQSQICSSCRRECVRRSIERRVPADNARGFHANAGSTTSRRVEAVSHAILESSAAACPTGSSRALRRARRKAGASTVFTAGYATIMATVAAADADRKVRHREDMGRRLDDARQDLARILHDPAPLDYSLTIGLPPSSVDDWAPDGSRTIPAPTIANTPTTTSPNEVIEAIKAICVPPAQLRSHAAQAQQREAYLTWLHSQFGLKRRWWSKRPEPDGGLEGLAEAMLQEEMASRETLLEGQREPQGALQFARMIEATNRLVDNLVEEGHRIGSFGDPAAQKASMERLESPWHAMKLLRSDGYPNFRLPDLDPVATTKARLEANDAARRIFENWSQARIWGRPRTSAIDLAMRRKVVSPEVWNAKEVKFWVAKLCYNMLVSPAPPGIHNYNILMLGFISVGQHTLAQIVAESLLYDTRMLPTQQTLVCLLHQARAQGDLVAFHRVLRRLVALDQNGIRIRRRAIPDVARYRTNREWARSNDVNLAGGYVVQRATVDGPVTDAIITGLLSLDQVRHAAVVFSAHLSRYSKMDAASLNTILNPVLDAVDIPAARVLLRGFAQNASIITDMLMNDDRSARKLSMKIRTLLAIATAPEPALRAQQPGRHDGPGGQGWQRAEVQMEPTHAEPEPKPESESALVDDAVAEKESGAWVDDDGHLMEQQNELAELMYARRLYEERKKPTKAQMRLLKKYGVFGVSQETNQEALASAKSAQYFDPGAALMLNGANQRSRNTNYGTSIDQLSSALFVSDATHYLGRLSQIVHAAHGALRTDEDEFVATADSWISEFTNLEALPYKHRSEQEQYRRMARLKAVEQTAEAVLSACSHVMEAFMETVTADLAATSAAAAAAEAEAESAALQAKSGYSFMSIVKSFLQRTSVPFGLRLGTYLSAKQASQQAADETKQAASDTQPDPDSGWDSSEFDAPSPAPSSLPFSLSPSLAQQIALLERHLTEDMPAISGLLEERFKEILLQAVFPQKENSRNSLKDSMALRRRARTLSLEALLEARHLLLEYGARLEDKPPVLSFTEAGIGGEGVRVQLTQQEQEQQQQHKKKSEARQTQAAEPKGAYGIFRMCAIFSG